jgi:DinB superfamily
MTWNRTDQWAALVAGHSRAIQEFALTAGQVPSQLWNQPISAGKWTPAQTANHLIESYRVLRGELGGAPGMQLRLSPVKRWVLRRTLLPRILTTGSFPAGARAPRETRPGETVGDPGSCIRALTTEAEGFVQELSEKTGAGRVRLTHAYFGRMSARQSLLLVTVHTRHHARQLAAVLTPSPSL